MSATAISLSTDVSSLIRLISNNWESSLPLFVLIICLMEKIKAMLPATRMTKNNTAEKMTNLLINGGLFFCVFRAAASLLGIADHPFYRQIIT
jgi:hypothetical protein